VLGEQKRVGPFIFVFRPLPPLSKLHPFSSFATVPCVCPIQTAARPPRTFSSHHFLSSHSPKRQLEEFGLLSPRLPEESGPPFFRPLLVKGLFFSRSGVIRSAVFFPLPPTPLVYQSLHYFSSHVSPGLGLSFASPLLFPVA